MRILAIPASMRIGTRRTHTVIPICKISHIMGTKTPTPHIICGEGQTEGATWSITLQQGLIQR